MHNSYAGQSYCTKELKPFIPYIRLAHGYSAVAAGLVLPDAAIKR